MRQPPPFHPVHGYVPPRVRAETHDTHPTVFITSGKTFREWNVDFEKWMAKAYSTNRIFTHGPDENYQKYLLEWSNKNRQENIDVTLNLSKELVKMKSLDKDFLETLCDVWGHHMTQRQREDMVIGILEPSCRRAEEGKFFWRRQECPELTLKWMTGADKEGWPNWFIWWRDQEVPEKDGSLPYKNLRNKDWDRVNGVLEAEEKAKSGGGVPFKKSVKMFILDGITLRNWWIRQTVLALVYAICKMNTPTFDETKAVYKGSNSDSRMSRDERAVVKEQAARGQGFVEATGQDASKNFCVNCFQPDRPEKKLKQCGRCKSKVNRTVNYCSAECQKNHYPQHKQNCGKLLSETVKVPSFSSSPTPSTPSTPAPNSNASTSTRGANLTPEVRELAMNLLNAEKDEHGDPVDPLGFINEYFRLVKMQPGSGR